MPIAHQVAQQVFLSVFDIMTLKCLMHALFLSFWSNVQVWHAVPTSRQASATWTGPTLTAAKVAAMPEGKKARWPDRAFC